MPTPDGRIGARDLCAGAAVERVIADGGVTSLKISATLQSDNYSAGSAGWQINRATGSAEFQDVVVRGTLNADDITTGTLSVDRIGANSIGFGKITLTAALEATQYIQSTTYTPGSAGWRINADGTAEFDDVTVRGTITAGAGSDVDWSYIGNVAIVNADITNVDAGKITTGTLNVGRISSNSLTMGKIELAAALETSQYLQSTSYSAGSSGWKILADGTAEFNDVTMRGDVFVGDATNSVTIDATAWGVSIPEIVMNAGGTSRDVKISYYGALDQLEITTGTSGGYLNLLNADASSFAGGFTLHGHDNGVISGDVHLVGGTLEMDEPIYADYGAVGAPGYSFDGDTNTGMYRAGTDIIGFSSAGTKRLQVDTGGVDVVGNLDVTEILSVNEISADNGSVSDVSYYFGTDNNTGLYHVAENYFAASAASSIIMQWGHTGTVKEIYMYGLASSDQASVEWNSGTNLVSYFSSTRRIKKNIRPITDIGLTDLFNPSWFDYRTNDEIDDEEMRVTPDTENQPSMGLIAEEVVDVLPLAGIYGDDQKTPVSYKERHVQTAMLVDLQDARRRIAKLEEAL